MPDPVPRLGRVRRVLAIAGLPSVLLALAGLAGGTTWAGALAIHLAIPALAPLLVLAAIAPGWRLRAILVVGAVAIVAPWLVALATVPAAPAPVGAAFAAASLNCYDFNPDRPALRAGLAAIAADVVALQEVTLADEPAVAAAFPYRVWPATEHLYRTALVSRFPIRSALVHDLGGYACIEAVVAAPRGDIRVFASHLHSPKRPSARAAQLAQFQRFAALVAAAPPGPVLVLADCNATPADPAWRGFCRAAGLSRPGWGWPATWPSWLGPFGLPIDHVLGRGLALGRLRPLPIPGSDHRGVAAAVAIAAP